MDISKLIRYGIPESVIKSWQKNQGEKLLPLQKEALTKYRLLEGESLLISAPTSSGKTFCGELASVVNIFHRKKVVFLVPLKAIAEEKYSDFSEKYSHLGIKVIISTRDRKEFDQDLENGDFDLAIVIYEKFNQVLIKNLDLLSQINLLIVDELQMIGDDSRGHILELILTKILSTRYHPQILGLSAVLSETLKTSSLPGQGRDFKSSRCSAELSEWLGLKLLHENKRPVELLQGVLFEGKFHYRKYNSGEDEIEEFLKIDTEKPDEILFFCLEKLLKDDEQVLVFLKGKFESEKLAIDFAERIDLPRANSAISELFELEPTSLKDKLIFCLEKGIAFHNADLSYDERNIIEKFYLKGEITTIFSTTTLSMGVNLPAKTVFIETQKYQTPEYSQKTVLCPILWEEYENMSGRAGRLKKALDFGRSIVIATNQFHFESLWDQYIETKEQSILPRLYQLNLEDIILDFVASGCAKNIFQLKNVLSKTFSKNDKLNEDLLKEKIGFLLEKKIFLLEKENLYASELGKTFALLGITIRTGLAIKKMLEQKSFFGELCLFYKLLETDDGEKLWVGLTPQEEQKGFYEQKVEDCQKLKSLLEDELVLTLKQKRKIKLSLLFSDWISDIPTKDIEKKYSLRSGFIKGAAERLSWLLDASHLIAKVTKKQNRQSLDPYGDAPQNTIDFLKNLSQKVLFGVNEKGLKLASLRIPNLGRDFIWTLVKNNLYKLDKLKTIKLEELEKIIPEIVAQRLKETLNRLSDEKKVRMHQEKGKQNKRFEIPKKISYLILDGEQKKDKFLTIINGKYIYLPAKSFKYLLKLAWAKVNYEDGWIHKLDLEPGENQAKYLYRLKTQIKSFCKLTQTLIENNRTGSYRLKIPKGEIDFNLNNLDKLFDLEIKKLISEDKNV